MKQTRSFFITASLLLLSVSASYQEIKDHQVHFGNVHNNDYILAVFHNPKKNSKLTKPLKAALDIIAKSPSVKNNGVVVEYINTQDVPFFDKHYDLDGSNGLKLFVRNQIVNKEDFGAILEQRYQKSEKDADFAAKIERFIADTINGISTQLKDIEHFRQILNDKRTVGLYSGDDNSNFKTYHLVAKKHIDFTFTHTFDASLKEAIYAQFGEISAPKTDAFAIVRHSDALNDFDTRPIVSYDIFGEKELTEFLTHERHDKLRGPDQGNDIVKTMFYKNQPLFLFVKSNKNSQKFETFKEAVQALPKRFIYGYSDTDTPNAGAYMQLFMMAQQMMGPEQAYVIWVTPSRKVKVEAFGGEFNKAELIKFVFDFHEQNKAVFEGMQKHLYDEAKEEQIGQEL